MYKCQTKIKFGLTLCLSIYFKHCMLRCQVTPPFKLVAAEFGVASKNTINSILCVLVCHPQLLRIIVPMESQQSTKRLG